MKAVSQTCLVTKNVRGYNYGKLTSGHYQCESEEFDESLNKFNVLAHPIADTLNKYVCIYRATTFCCH